MKASNLQFKSNLYVLTSGHKNTQEFVSKVSDAKTLLQIHRRGGGILLDWQKRFAEQGMSCALAKKIKEDHTAEVIDHHTHGIITENGEKVCVCKCQHEECPRFSACSSRDDFRRITLIYEPEIPGTKPKPTERDSFTYEEPPRVEKVTTVIQPIIQEQSDEWTWHNYKGWKEEHGVRGHWRTLADGSKTWVREHIRGGEKPGYEHPDNIIGGKPQPKPQVPVAEPVYIDTGEFEDSEFTPDFMIGNLVQIESAERIITAPVEERVLVNGGAGTGKTHTVIERLKHILKNNLTQADKVYVLCFSRSAVKVIRKAWKWITRTATGAATGIVNGVNNVVGAANDAWNYISGAANYAWNYVSSAATDVWNRVSNAAIGEWNYITGAAKYAWNYVSNAAAYMWNRVSNAAIGEWNYITGEAKHAWNWFNGDAWHQSLIRKVVYGALIGAVACGLLFFVPVIGPALLGTSFAVAVGGGTLSGAIGGGITFLLDMLGIKM